MNYSVMQIIGYSSLYKKEREIDTIKSNSLEE